MVNDNIGGDDIHATQSRLITPDSHCESFGCERFNVLLVFDLDDWKREWKLGKENMDEGRDGQPWIVQGVRAR